MVIFKVPYFAGPNMRWAEAEHDQIRAKARPLIYLILQRIVMSKLT
jgi:hypothetical protein